MTDKLHYQDVFKTINIPKSERRFANRALHLFNSANGREPWNPSIHQHLWKTINNGDVSQVFWQYDIDTRDPLKESWEQDEHFVRTHDLMVLTAMTRGLTIALEHRNLRSSELPYRKSLHIENGRARIFSSSMRATDGIESETEAVDAFKQVFFERAAHLGLYHRATARHHDYSESDSDSLVRAA